MHAPAVGSIFAGLQRLSGLNAVAQPQHHRQVFRREQLRHEVDLLDADAVLAGHAAAAGGCTRPGSRGSPASTRFDLVGVALVEQQDRMDVAVAGVKDVGDADVVLLADAR